MEIAPELAGSIFGMAQLIILSLTAWTLKSVTGQGNRLTKVETMLETSIISDIKDLNIRVRNMEKHKARD